MEEKRKTRTTITPELIRMARDLIAREMPISEISSFLRLSYNAAFNLCKKIHLGLNDNEIIRKKGRKKKDSIDTRANISSLLLRDNALTQRGIVDQLNNTGISVSQSFISKELKDMGITRKRLSIVPQERNNPRTKDLRQVFGRELEHIPMSRIIYLDETGFNLHCAQNYGYSPINTKAYVTIPANRGQNISLMAAITIEGILYYEVQDGAFNGDLFIPFITNHLVPYFNNNPDSILIMDNCRFHHRADVLGVLNEYKILYKFLPPYSPQLNPIEEFFSELKANYRAMRPMPASREEIKARIKELMGSRAGNFINSYERASRLIPLAIARNDFI